jgi:DnaK suppressor protein
MPVEARLDLPGLLRQVIGRGIGKRSVQCFHALSEKKVGRAVIIFKAAMLETKAVETSNRNELRDGPMAHVAKRREELADLLLKEKRRLWGEVRRELFDTIGDKLHGEYDFPQDVGDRGLIDVLEDTGLAVADIRRQELTRIDEALGRLEVGRYGRCEDCGTEISLKRLQAEPYAPCCIRCQEKREGPPPVSGRTL